MYLYQSLFLRSHNNLDPNLSTAKRPTPFSQRLYDQMEEEINDLVLLLFVPITIHLSFISLLTSLFHCL
jgi:hypothetical protein